LISSYEIRYARGMPPRRRGPGRPRTYRRKATVSVVLEAAERRAIARAARTRGVTVAAWMRAAALAALATTSGRRTP
jgi:hypothetical protein